VELRQVREKSEFRNVFLEAPNGAAVFFGFRTCPTNPSTTYWNSSPTSDVPISEIHNPIPTCPSLLPSPLQNCYTSQIDWFEQLLLSHPNTHSSIQLLWSCEAFRPFLNFVNSAPDLGTIKHVACKSHLDFSLNNEWGNRQDHFSPAFGPALLPGMYSMPIGVVPKPHSTDLHSDHSAGEHVSITSLLMLTASIKPDSLQYFSATLCAVLCSMVTPAAF